MILLTRDFYKTLPVILRSTLADEKNACLETFNLWSYVNTFKLNMNMRVVLQNAISAEVFSNALLNIGKRNISVDASTGL